MVVNIPPREVNILLVIWCGLWQWKGHMNGINLKYLTPFIKVKARLATSGVITIKYTSGLRICNIICRLSGNDKPEIHLHKLNYAFDI
jgi:hypothetical protein